MFNLNKDEWMTLITALVSKGGAAVFGAGVMTSSDSAMIAGGVFALGSLAVTAYTSYNMRKVPETAVVTSLASTVTVAKAQSIPQAK